VLGLMALAREPLSRAHLLAFLADDARSNRRTGNVSTLGMLSVKEIQRHLDAVLRLTQELFDPRDPAQGSVAPYRFYHTLFPEFITAQLSEVEQHRYHRLLAQGCQRVLSSGRPHASIGPAPADRVRDYALRHRLAHLITAQDWQAVACAFADADYIVERSKRFGFADVHADALIAMQAAALPSQWQEAFGACERFLRWRIERLQYFPQAYQQEMVNEFLPIAPEPFTNALSPASRDFSHMSPFSLHKVSGHSTLSGIGHADRVTMVAFAPAGHWVVSGSGDGTVKVWQASTGRLVADCVGHRRGVLSVAFSPDSRWVVSGGEDGTVKVWEASTGRLVADCVGLFWSRKKGHKVKLPENIFRSHSD
jgi:hypothetical protein